jgi:hypothetical protein
MRFVVPCTNRLQLSLAVAHGAVDAARPPEQLLLYGLALLPIPGPVCTSGFAVASLLHFAADLGMPFSIGLHTVVYAVATTSFARAMAVMLSYMTYIHIPLLVLKLCLTGQVPALVCLGYAALACVAKGIPFVDSNGEYTFGHKQQLLVVCHVILSYL